jgi:3-oxoacyl-[acyl-carrier protein] reductase
MTVIVTGASRGLGASIAERLVSKGIDVFGIARNAGSLPYEAASCDVSSYEAVKSIAQHLKKSKREVTGVINAAGIASMNLALTTTEASTQKILQTNLAGTIYCCQHFAPLMIRQKTGTIINFSTIAVAIGLKGESIYAASKAGVEGFSRSFAREVADFGLRVNCIAPGPIDTDLLSGVSSGQIQRIVSQQVIAKQHEKDDVCDLCEILLDPRSRSLSGQVLHVGGV